MQYRVKKRWPILAIAVTALMGFGIFSVCFQTRDDAGYQALKKRVNPSVALASEPSYSASQERQGVQKEIWQAKSGERFKTVVNCSSAELAFEKEGKGQAVVEQMRDVVFETFGNRKHLIEASFATYHYSTKHLVADNVKIKLIKESGQPFLSGRADCVEHAFEDEAKSVLEAVGNVTFDFDKVLKAESKRALFEGEDTIRLQEDVTVFFNGKGALKTSDEIQLVLGKKGIDAITCVGKSVYRMDDDDQELSFITDGDIVLDNVKHIVTFKDGKDQLFFSDRVKKIYADKAELTYLQDVDGFQLNTLDLRGDVTFIHRAGSLMQYVLADRVLYNNQTQEMRFYGSKRRRALFFDKINDLKVSAEEIKMKRDEKTKQNHFEGVGDVRFHFAEVEFERLRKHFLTEKNNL